MGPRQPRTQSRSQPAIPPPVAGLGGGPGTTSFENKAGRYQLVRVEENMVHYTFTNHSGHQIDAAMPMATWRRLQERIQLPKVSIS